jgi:hypothetical protein
LPSKFICGECGAENIISGFAVAGEPRRCAVCGAVQNNAAGRAPADSSLEPGRLESPSAARYEEQKYNNDYRPARPDTPRKLRAQPLTGKIIVALIIFTFIAVALSNKKERRYYESSKVKMCVSNMKTIEGAVALYLMENDLENKNYPPVLEIKVLVNNGYLKKEPRCPENGTYKMSLFKIDKINLYEVSCDKHGGLLKLSDKNRGL